MKKIGVLLFIAFLSLGLNSLAQNLSNQFNTISANHDMMGGSLVVFCKNGIFENISIGKADLGRNINVTENTKFRIASISKTITAIAILQLVDQNLLNLDVDISTILGYPVKNPYYPSNAITTRMLLSHTSTIIDGTTYNYFMSATINDNPIPNLSQLLTHGGTYYTTGQFNNSLPGSYFNYSNVNYVILGTIVENVSNLRFDIYCKQNICNPLGIDASFNVNDLTDINQLAVLYRKTGGIWTPQADNYLGIQPVHNNLSGYIVGTNGGRFGPQGGFRCSAKDLSKIFLTLMNGGSYNGVTLLSQASCNSMFTNEWTFNGSNGNNYYGLFRSWGLGIHRITSTQGNDIVLQGCTSMLGHTGEAYGLVSDAYFDTIRKVGLVFITNGVGIGYQTNNNSAFYTVEQEIFNAVENYGNISYCSQNTVINSVDFSCKFIYPNPCKNFINIQESLSQKGCFIEIFTFDGRKVKSIFLDKGKTRIETQDLKKGMYILELNRINNFLFLKE